VRNGTWLRVNGQKVAGIKLPDGTVVPADEINQPAPVEPDRGKDEE
jgi:hypothetical protein